MINSACAKPALKMFLKLYFPDNPSYKKGVSRDCFFTFLGYDNLISKHAMNNELEKKQKVIQLNDARNKLMKMIPGTTE